MKALIRIAIFLFLLVFSAPGLQAGKEAGNGGDRYAMEFIAYGHDVVAYLKRFSLGEIPVDFSKFESALQETRVVSIENLLLDGLPVEAINYPEKKLIEIDRGSWIESKGNRDSSMALALHEYLWIMGIDDTNYRWTRVFWEKINGIVSSTKNYESGFECRDELDGFVPMEMLFKKKNGKYDVAIGIFDNGKRLLNFQRALFNP